MMTTGQESAKGAPTARPRRRRWLKRGAIALVALAVCYTLFGFFGVPLLIRKVGMARLNDRLHGDATLADASFNPFTMALSLDGLVVRDAAGRQVGGFERFEGGVRVLASVFREGWRFPRAVLTKPMGVVEIDAEGRINLQDLWITRAEAQPGEPLRAIPRFVVGELAVRGMSASFRDDRLEEPFEKRIENLDFTISGFDSDPEHSNQHSINATLGDGATIAWNGSFFVDPLTASGTVTLSGLDASSFMPYLSRWTTVRLVSGRASVEVAYDFAPVRAERRALVALRSLTFEEISIREGEDRVLDIPRIALTGLDVDATARTLSLDLVRVEGLAGQIVREADGSLRLSRFMRETRAAQERAALDRAQRVDVQAIEFPLVQLSTAVRHLIEDLTLEWAIDATRIELDGATIDFIDRSTPAPVEARISELRLAAGPATSEADFHAPFEVACKVNGSPLRASGEVRPLEPGADARIEADAIALAPFAQYMPQDLPAPLTGATLAGGAVSLDGAASMQMREGAPLEASWKGEFGLASLDVRSSSGDASIVAVESLEVSGEARVRLVEGSPQIEWDGATSVTGARVDGDFGQPLAAGVGGASLRGSLRLGGEAPGLRFTGDVEATEYRVAAPEIQSLRAEGASARLGSIAFDQDAATLSIASVSADAPRVRAEVGLIPVESLEDDEAAEQAIVESAERAGAALPLAITVGQVSVRDGRIEIVDPQAGEEAAIVAEALEVDASGIATDGATVAAIEVRASVQGTGAVSVKGEADPFRAQPYADVVVEVQGVPLRPYSPFTEPRLGFETERGRLNLTIPLRLENNQVEGRLDVLLDAFHLGERVEAPSAPDVPLKLGLNLLRNRNDQITVGAPFSGDITDPKFTIGGVIWRAFFDLLGRAATAPFQLLANAFGGGADVDLSQVPFEPGSAGLTPDALSTVDTLGRALYERPSLTLTVTGVYDSEADAQAIRVEALRASLLARAQASDPGLMRLDDAQRQVQLASLFAERFPERAPIVVPVPPGARDQATTPPEEMEAALLGSIEVTTEQLAALGAQRAEAAVAAMVADAGVEQERIRIAPARAAAEGETARAVFEIGAGE